MCSRYEIDEPTGLFRLAIETAEAVGRMHGIEDTIWHRSSVTLAEELHGWIQRERDHEEALAEERTKRLKAEKHRDAAYTEAWRIMDDSEESHRERNRNDIKLVTENDLMLEQVDALKTERDALKAELAEEREKRDTLKVHLSHAHEACDHLRDERDEFRDRLNAMPPSEGDALRELPAFEDIEPSEDQKRRAAEFREVVLNPTLIPELRAERDALAKRVAELKRDTEELDDRKKDHASMVRDVDRLRKRVAELEKERDQSALAWSDVETALNFGGAPEADTYANRITAAIQSLTKSRDANLQAVASAEERVAELERELASEISASEPL